MKAPSVPESNAAGAPPDNPSPVGGPRDVQEPIDVQPRTLPWRDYPIGTRAPAFNGGAWTRVESGWKWGRLDGSGGVFPTPGGDADGTVELPKTSSVPEGPKSEAGSEFSQKMWTKRTDAWRHNNFEILCGDQVLVNAVNGTAADVLIAAHNEAIQTLPSESGGRNALNLQMAAEEALGALTVLKLSDSKEPIIEICPELRAWLYEAHDLLLLALQSTQAASDGKERGEYPHA